MAMGDDIASQRSLDRLVKSDGRIDPQNPQHVAAFQALRVTCLRVTTAAFWRYMDSRTSHIEQRSAHILSYWLVPKQRLVITQEIADALVTKQRLDDLGATGTTSVDWANFHVMDKAIPRPMGCSEISFTLGQVNRYNEDAQPQAPSEPQP